MQNSSLETFINLLSVYTHNCKDNYLDCSTLKIQVFVKVQKFISAAAALFTAENKVRFKAPPAGRKWICISFSSVSCRYFFMSSFTKLKFNHSVSVFEMIQSNLNKLLMLHLCSIFVWIMINMQWLPLILNGKSTDKALFYMTIYILCVLFIWFGGLF